MLVQLVSSLALFGVCLAAVVPVESEWEKDPCDDVAIVGAGSAGTYAAYRLKDKGLRISLYEYSDRVGGRLHTWNMKGAEDVNVEMGGMRYAKWLHPVFSGLVDKLNLNHAVFTDGFGYANRTRYYLRGTSLQKKDFSGSKLPYNLTAEERLHAPNLMMYYIRKLVGEDVKLKPHNVLTLKTKDGSKFLYELCFKEAMDLAGASQEAQRLMIESSGFRTLFNRDVSFGSLLQDMIFSESDRNPVYTVHEGMDSVPKALLSEFLGTRKGKHKFHPNHQLTEIHKHSKNGYELYFEETSTTDGYTEGNGDIQKKCARKVILAIPHYALSRVFWKPLQEDPDIRDNLDSLYLAPASKIALTFPTAFWKTAIHNATVLKTDLLIRQSYDFGHSKKGTSVIIASYSDGEAVRDWRRKQKQGTSILGSVPGDNRVTTAILNRVKEDFSKAFDLPVSNIPSPVSGVLVFHDAFPSGCGWTLWKVGSHWDQVSNALIKPVATEDVFLATSDIAPGFLTGWVEGALTMVDKVVSRFF